MSLGGIVPQEKERREVGEKEVRGEKERWGSEHPCPRVNHIAEFTITHTRASLAAHIVHIIAVFFLSYTQ